MTQTVFLRLTLFCFSFFLFFVAKITFVTLMECYLCGLSCSAPNVCPKCSAKDVEAHWEHIGLSKAKLGEKKAEKAKFVSVCSSDGGVLDQAGRVVALLDRRRALQDRIRALKDEIATITTQNRRCLLSLGF